MKMLAITIIATLCFSAVAMADDAGTDAAQSVDAGATDSDATDAPDIIEAGSGLFKAAKAGEVLISIGFGLFVLLGIVRIVGGKLWPDFWKSKAGGYTLAAMGLVATFAALLVSGTGLTTALLGALGVTTSAMGIQGPASAIGSRVGLIRK